MILVMAVSLVYIHKKQQQPLAKNNPKFFSQITSIKLRTFDAKTWAVKFWLRIPDFWDTGMQEIPRAGTKEPPVAPPPPVSSTKSNSELFLGGTSMTRVSRGVRRDIPAGAVCCRLLGLGMFSTLQDPAVHTLPPCFQSPDRLV